MAGFRAEWNLGPRALGGRSILADPRSEKMQKELNLKIKFRESFRPFAPSILEEKLNKWFDLEDSSPYMLLVAKVKKEKLIKQKETVTKKLNDINNIRSIIPSVTHIDDSARVQTVNAKLNQNYYNLIKEFFRITKTPILINTSFNIRGEPIVCSPNDAFRCFMGTNLDILVIENFVLEKKNQKKSLFRDYKESFSLD